MNSKGVQGMLYVFLSHHWVSANQNPFRLLPKMLIK